MKKKTHHRSIEGHGSIYFIFTVAMSTLGIALTVLSLPFGRLLFYLGVVSLTMALISLGLFCFHSSFKIEQAKFDFSTLSDKVDALSDGNMDETEYPDISLEALELGEKLNRLPFGSAKKKDDPRGMDERTFLSYLPGRVRSEPSRLSAVGVYIPGDKENPKEALDSFEDCILGTGKRRTFFFVPNIGNKDEFLGLLEQRRSPASAINVIFSFPWSDDNPLDILMENISLESGIHDLGYFLPKPYPGDYYFGLRDNLEEAMTKTASEALERWEASSAGVFLKTEDGFLLLFEARGAGYSFSNIYGEEQKQDALAKLNEAISKERVTRLDHLDFFGLSELEGHSLYARPLYNGSQSLGFVFILALKKHLEEEANHGLFFALKEYAWLRLLGANNEGTTLTVRKKGLEANVPIDLASKVSEVIRSE